ncbi:MULTISPECIES: C40 family peptidase [Hungatella]|uniref:SH3 domain-containing protein n=1 Tax=Hungatella hathewayi TaxID=154046 RepID=A0AAW9W932_9FIRM|nr:MULTISPECIES: SH3 domain-containing protein [Hungatella]MCD7964804.1 SH3 domain-containing protein [Clostridiaceae bacterium]MCQ4827422.1 SH3 domain-containing protein [Hungatella sp. SL.1.14]MUB61535.1 SH3 domain-containing protein [Hungatella hathewayi]CUO99925.1 NLP/P60 protein [Hungatella hathewayi]
MENKSDKSEKKDYVVRLNKARKKRNKNDYERYLILAAIAIVVVVIIIFAGKAIAKRVSAGAEKTAATEETGSQGEESDQLTIDAKEAEESEAEAQAKKTEEEKKAVVDSYQNLGIVQVSGYLNVRKEPNTSADIVGKLMGDSACEILDSTQEGWYKISSGGIEGYIDSQYVLTGDEAKKKAYDLVSLRAIVQVDNLNIRKEANTTSDVVGQGLLNERYEVIDQLDGWVQIPSGYMSADYVKLEYALNEARKLDLKAMIFNMYKNIGISDVDNYLNVREEPSENGKIIAKMPSKAAGNILETTDNGWYKIQSGKITGYVKSDYILTGQPAKDEALKVAELMAIVNTDMLNARSEPSTDSKIWTQISNNEKYPVLKQIDGWVEIELEEDSNAYVASDYVDVRYALPEAIKFSPLEEKANAAASLRTQIVNYALQFLGNPYVWGGTSLTKGADCSGFTLSVFGHFGISLPHYSGSQANMGKAVKSSEMRPGDLVFYANSKGTINHVGIYIGNGQIVNAASRRSGIKISTWNYRTPVRIRNILGD